MRIATWNVDGFKARRKELVLWLQEEQPTVVGLQEIKTDDVKFLRGIGEELAELGYHAAFHEEARCRGVAILSKQPLEVTEKGLPGQGCRGARLLTASTAGLSFTTVCVPGSAGKDNRAIERKRRLERKLDWLDSLIEHLRERKTDNGPAVLCGDFNITPKPIDNYPYWKGPEENKNGDGNREEERWRISSLLEAGWFDLVRELNPKERMFSWWWPKNNFFKDDKGRRIDLVLGNKAVVKRLQCARIDRGRRGKSDHAPVVVDLT